MLSNFIRKVNTYIENTEYQECNAAIKIKSTLFKLTKSHNISLFDEEDDPDSSLITNDLIHDLTLTGLDLVSDLIKHNQQLAYHIQKQSEMKPVVKQVELGIDLPQMKEMQSKAR